MAETCLSDEDVSVKGVIKVNGGTRTTGGQTDPGGGGGTKRGMKRGRNNHGRKEREGGMD